MALREDIRQAIMKGIDEDDRPIADGEVTMKDVLDPDTCGRVADEVVAVLMSKLTGQHFETRFHKTIIGPASFVYGEIYE